ncbi:MAG: DUF3859 domain-containing protein [Cytophagaceae bacterium]
MIKVILYCGLILIIAGCSIFRNTSKDSSEKIEVNEIQYGICETKRARIENMESSPSGNHIRSTEFSLVEQTDRIPGNIGQKFGVEFIIKSTIENYIFVEQVWMFPKSIIDDEGKTFNELRYKIKKPTNKKTYSTYTLEKEYEIVKGVWTYQMFYEGEKIYERKFYVE